MKKIALAGLCEHVNCGEKFLTKTIEYLVKTAEPDAQVVFVSFERVTSGLKYLVTQKMLDYSRKTKHKNWGYKIQYLVIKMRFQKYFMEKLRGCNAVIFSCGSFKYTTQYLWAHYSVVIECCKKLNIPVMFDAMDIQKYNEKDWRCLCLKNHANYGCVKMITTRDGDFGVERLDRYYIQNPMIKRCCVGDPGFWIKECYKAEKKQSEIIGVNLLKVDNFLAYGGKTTEQKVVKVYAEFLQLLEKNGYKYELFTNGMPIDTKMVPLIEKELDVEPGRISVRIPENEIDLVNIISSYKGILGARLHACVCAYSLDVPVAGFMWAEKMQHLAEVCKLSDLFCTEDEFEAKNLFVNLETALNTKYDIENREMWKKRTRDSIAMFLEDINEE